MTGMCRNIALGVVAIVLAGAQATFAQNGSRTWTGNTSTDFYDGSNWSAAGDFPNGNVSFADSALTGAANTTIDRASPNYNYVYGLYFNNTLGTQNSYTINGPQGFALGGSVVRTLEVTSGSLTDVINANIADTGSADTFDIRANHHLDMNGVYSGGNTTTKTGDGILTFNGANTYTGAITIDGGTLVLDAPSSYYSYTGGQISINNGSTLRVQDSYLFQNDAFVFGSSGGGNLDIGAGNNVFRSDHTFTTLGGSQNTITQSSTWGMNCDGTGTRTFNVADGSDDVDLLVSAQMSNNGSVAKTGAGTMTLTAANTYSGGTTVSAGTLTIDGTGSLGSGSYAGAIANNAALVYGSSANQTLSGIISGTGTLTKTNTSTLTLAGANTYSGATAVNGGVLQAGASSAFGNNSPLTAASGATVRLAGNSVTIGSLAGAGTVENAGSVSLLSDDFSSGSTPPDQWRAYESRLDTGWNATRGGSNFSEWDIAGGRLENPDVAGHYLEGEAPAWQWWTNPETGSAATTLEISFDYATDGSDTLTAHFWAVQTGGTPGANNFISNIEGWSNGNSGQNQDTTSGGYDTFNLLDGDTTPDSTDYITGQLNGSGTFTLTIDVSALGIAGVSTVGDIDTFFLAFAANETGGGTTWVDNLSVRAGDEATLTTGADNTSTTFSGTIQDGADSMALALTKTGAGTQTLSGTCDYTGATTVDAGTLEVASGGTLTTISVDVESSATCLISGGTLTATGVVVRASGELNVTGGALNTTAVLGTDSALEIKSGGLAEISGGTHDIYGRILNYGTLRVTGNAATIAIHEIPNVSDGTFEFTLDSDGVSTLTDDSWIGLGNATISVDGSAYSGGESNILLFDSNNLVSTSTVVNVSGFHSKYSVSVTQDQDAEEVTLVIAESSEYAFELADVADLGELTTAPTMRADDSTMATTNVSPGEMKAIYFDALDYTGSSTRVYAYLGIPAGASAGSPVPGVVLVHGGGGTAFDDWVTNWTGRGYAAISIAVEGQTDTVATQEQKDNGEAVGNWLKHAMPGPARVGIYGDSGVEPITDQWMYHAVTDTVLANSLLRSLPEVDAGKVGVMGISWGGVITSTAIGVDDRFAFAVPTYGCGNLDESLNVYGTTLSADNLYINVWDPMIRISNVTMPVLWYSWPTDWHFALDSQADCYTSAPGQHMVSLVPGMGHGHSAAWVRPESYEFADSVLAGTPWCLQQSATLSDNVAEVTFSSTKTLDSAELVSTDDVGHTGDRTWTQTAATLVDNGGGNYTITATLPRYTTAWFINGLSGSLVASSDFQETGVVPPDEIVYDTTANWSSQVVDSDDMAIINNGATVTLDEGLLVENGSFEPTDSPDVAYNGFSAIGDGSGSLSGWTVSGCDAYLIDGWDRFGNEANTVAADGDQYLQLQDSGSSAATISQDIDTKIGTTYELSFDYSGVDTGAHSVELAYSVGGTNRSVSYSTATPMASWQTETYSFQATSTTTTISFTGYSVGGGFYGVGIDNIRVTTTPATSDTLDTLIVNDDASPTTATLTIAQDFDLTVTTAIDLGDDTGAGYVNQSAGTVTTAALTINSSGSGDTSQYNLSGGSLQADSTVINNAGELNFTGGSIKSDGTITVNAGGTFKVNRSDTVTQGTDFGTISGAGDVQQNGSGTLVLNTNNTYTGETTVNAGDLKISHDNALGGTSGGTTVNGGQLYVAGGITNSEPITIGSTAGTGSITGTEGGGRLMGAITIEDGNTDFRGSDLHFSGGLTGVDKGLGFNGPRFVVDTNPIDLGNGSFGVTSCGTDPANACLLNVGGNDWLQTGINFSGYLKLGGSNTMPTDTLVRFGWSSKDWSTGILDLNGYDQTVALIELFSNSRGLGGDINITGGGTLTVDQSTSSAEYQGRITDGTTATALTKSNTGTLILNNLSGTDTSYSGATAVNGGVLQAGSAASLSPNSPHTIASGATLKLDGNSVSIGSLAGAGTVESAGFAALLEDDFSTGSITAEGRIYESRLDAGWRSTSGWGANPVSEWALTGSRLENPSVNTTYYSAGETPAWQWWTNPGTGSSATTLTISFDYATDGSDTLTAHFWAVQTGGSAGTYNFISNNQGWNNGNSGQNQDTTSGGYDTFNLLDGDTTPDTVDHITGQLNGSGTFTLTIDVSALGIAGVWTVGDIDTFFLAFAADETGGGTTWVDNLSVSAGDAILTTGGDNSSTTFSGTLQDGSGGSSLALTKTGTGTSTLTGTSTYTGRTTVDAGTLAVAGGSLTTTSVVVNASGTFRVSGDAATIQVAEITSASSGTFAFALDADGVSTVVDTVGCGLVNATIDVDGSAYTGGPTTMLLFDSSNLSSTSAVVNVSGFSSLQVSRATVEQDQVANEVRLVISGVSGSLFRFK